MSFNSKKNADDNIENKKNDITITNTYCDIFDDKETNVSDEKIINDVTKKNQNEDTVKSKEVRKEKESRIEEKNDTDTRKEKHKQNNKILKVGNDESIIMKNEMKKEKQKQNNKILKVGNDESIIMKNEMKKEKRDKLRKAREEKNAKILKETNLNIRQHRQLFSLHATLSNLYYIFANPINEENMKKLEVFYYKKAAIKNKKTHVGYTEFVKDVRTSIKYDYKGVEPKEMQNEIRRIWYEELSEEQRDMYRKVAYHRNIKEKRYGKAYE